MICINNPISEMKYNNILCFLDSSYLCNKYPTNEKNKLPLPTAMEMENVMSRFKTDNKNGIRMFSKNAKVET